MSVHILRTSSDFGGLLPEAIITLSSTFFQPLYNLAYEDRVPHPLAAYNVSWNRLLSAFKVVDTALRELPKNIQLDNPLIFSEYPAILDRQSELLYRINEHFDVCKNVIYSFIEPKQSGKVTKLAERYHNEFCDGFNRYRSRIRTIVNHLKHDGGQLRLVLDISTGLAGYFVEGVDEHGFLGPDPIIHKDKYPCFTFFRDLADHFVHLYEISRLLSGKIIEIVGQSNVIPATSINGSDKEFIQVARAISGYPLLFLPPERTLELPLVRLYTADDEQYLNLSYSLIHQEKIYEPPKPSTVCVIFVGDGISKTYRLPYKPLHAFPPGESQLA